MFAQDDIDRLKEKETAHDNCLTCHGRDNTCQSFKDVIWETRKIAANIKIKYRDYTLDGLKDVPKGLKKDIQHYLDDLAQKKKKGAGLLLLGNPGTAKSSIAYIVLMAAIKLDYTVYATSISDYMKIIGNSIHGDTQEMENAKDKLYEISKVDFLLLDDIGREFRDKYGFIDATIMEIIRSRADDNLPTIITTNSISEQDFSKNDLRLASIIKEQYTPFKFSGPDYRNKIAKVVRAEYEEKNKENTTETPQ